MFSYKYFLECTSKKRQTCVNDDFQITSFQMFRFTMSLYLETKKST